MDYKTAIKIKAAFNRAGAVREIQEITKQGNDIPPERGVQYAAMTKDAAQLPQYTDIS
ncbi:MAG: hypothetical protein QF466_02140 [Desulfobacterales bacterium]|nr:hypothetical protein [Desulfobacterales bacterium]MDP6681823.1 hypothetical protein [Desulfobacterales bacterium]MDP6808547.1 hypothetical protein [Desulfobacterales bacterium]